MAAMLKNFAAAVLSPMVDTYIVKQRDRLIPRALAIRPAEAYELRHYFSSGDLDRVRVATADPLPISDPPFSALMRRIGFDFPGVALAAAITFDHVIACREPMNKSVLFHELVHVVQYRLLGVGEFANRYVAGFLAHGSYHDIPLERCAFELEYRFANESQPFSVEAAVAEWIKAARF
jgi:hypothetical protein